MQDKPKATKLEKFLVFFIAVVLLSVGYLFVKGEIERRERAKITTLERTGVVYEILVGETNTVVPKKVIEDGTNVPVSTLVVPVNINAIRASVIRRQAEADKKAAVGVEENFNPEFDGVIKPVE
jgi:hypothetical protein